MDSHWLDAVILHPCFEITNYFFARAVTVHATHLQLATTQIQNNFNQENKQRWEDEVGRRFSKF